jgi:hypothetical protein
VGGARPGYKRVVARVQPSALERALDELYAATPEEFVLVRSRLAGELRGAGEPDAASDLRGRRRPNLAAWACNQLARQHADELGELLDVTRRAAAAQGAALRGGDPAQLRWERQRRQDLVTRLAGAGVQLLRGRAPKPDTYRDAISATLDAASLDPQAAEELRAGRLTRTLSPPAGFPTALGLAPSEAASEPGRDDALEAARRELADAQRAALQAEQAAKTAAAERASAELRADTATAHLQEVERALERARASVDEAGEQARLARVRGDEAQDAADHAARRVRDAEQRVGGSGRRRRSSRG